MRARMRLTAEKTNSTPLPFITFEILQTFKNENIKANCTEKNNLIKGITYTVNVNSWPCPHGPSLVSSWATWHILGWSAQILTQRHRGTPRPSPTPHPPCLPCQRKTKPQTTRTPKINTATAQLSLRLREDREGTARGGVCIMMWLLNAALSKKRWWAAKEQAQQRQAAERQREQCCTSQLFFSPLSDSYPINTLLRRWKTTH